VSVIDWTATGAPPPISTLPTLIRRSLATDEQCSGLSGKYGVDSPAKSKHG
jgi:hypothetical protein